MPYLSKFKEIIDSMKKITLWIILTVACLGLLVACSSGGDRGITDNNGISATLTPSASPSNMPKPTHTPMATPSPTPSPTPTPTPIPEFTDIISETDEPGLYTVPEQELETVNEADAAPAVTDAPAAEEPAENAAQEVAAEEVESFEDGENAPVPDYPKLENPVFMPIPSTVSDTVDFTDPKRDGFTANPGVYAGTAEKLLSDEAAEDLTVVVYQRFDGKVAELPIDALNANFKPYSYVNAKILRQKGLIPESAAEVKITAFGKIEKPLMVQASCFAPGVALIPASVVVAPDVPFAFWKRSG